MAGLETALQAAGETETELALRRILLVHGVVLTIGGIPLLYLGDEVGALNDYRYREDPAKAKDSRWVHRPFTDWAKMARRHDDNTPEGQLYRRLRELITIRQEHPVFSGDDMQVMDTGSEHVLGYLRWHEDKRILALANFSEQPEIVSGNLLRLHGLSYDFNDLVTGQAISSEEDLRLEPYAFICLEYDGYRA